MGGRGRGRSGGVSGSAGRLRAVSVGFAFGSGHRAGRVLPPLLPGTAIATPAQGGLASLGGPGAWAPLSR